MKITGQFARETGRDYALRMIKENLVNLELAPGSQISENELAEAMGISRTPVREALIELSKVRMIEIVPQKKSVVAPINYDLVEEARFMRYHLETAVMDLVCEKRTEEDLKKLEANVKLQNFYLQNGASEELMKLDDEYHEAMYAIAQMQEIWSLMQNMQIHFDRVRSMALTSVPDLKIVQDHEAMLDAIRRRDSEIAKGILQKHLSRYKVDAAAIRAKYPEYY